MSDGEASTSRLLDILGELIDLSPEDQARRLNEYSLSDAERERLKKWLLQRAGSESFLESPPALVLRTVSSGAESGRTINPNTEPEDFAALGTMPSVPGYEIKDLLGQGGMGTVWRAVQSSTGREVALKVMEPLLLVSARARSRFERELRLAARLHHPHIARVYDGGSSGTVCYNVMELIDGVPLDQFVESNQLSQRGILDLTICICHAVAHAHQNAVIHRDLKPSNILVDKDGQPHLLDFGLARALEEATADKELLLTLEGALAGTPAYMSPEQASGASTLDTRTDVYSLGVILYRLLTGRLPRDMSGSRLEVLRRIAETEPLLSRAGPKPIDRLLEAILLRALARSPEDRYPSVADFAKDLKAYLKGEAVTASPPSRSDRLWRFIRRNRVGLVVASAFATVLIAATAVSTWQAVRATKFGATALRERDNALRAQTAEAAQRRAAEQARAQTEGINGLLSGMTASTDLKGALERFQRSNRAGKQPLGSADVLSELADYMRGRGRVVEAEPLSLEALRQDQEAGITTGIGVLYHWNYHAQILEEKGDRDGAEQYTLKTLAEARREFPQPNRLLGYGIYSAALLLKEHGKYAQAEPLAREVRGMLDRFPQIDAAGGGDPALTICQQQIYTGLGNLPEAQRWATHLRALGQATLPELTAQVNGERYNEGKLAQRGAMYGRLGQFPEAIKDYTAAIGLNPADQYARYPLMSAYWGAGDHAGYRRVRREVLGMPVPASDPTLCGQIASACLIEPSEGHELAGAVRFAESAAQEHPDDPWCCLAEGMAQYRLGQYGAALVWLSRGLSSNSADDRRNATAEFFIAMSFERLGRDNAGQSAIRRGLEIMETTVQRPGVGDLGYSGLNISNDFERAVCARASQSEAEAMFALDASRTAWVASSDPAVSAHVIDELRSTSPAHRKIEILDEWISIQPDDAPALCERGLAFAEEGNFRRAAADLAKSIHIDPADLRSVRYGMPLLLISGDEARFSELRAQLLSRPSRKDAMMAASSLLRPMSADELDAADAIVDKLVWANRNDRWSCFSKGLAEYRHGHYSQAATWLTAADSDETIVDPDRLACSRFFLAIARYREGKKEEAQANLEIASQLLQRKTVKTRERNLSDSALLDWIICQLARSEAASAISTNL